MIRSLRIQNFKNFKDATFHFGPFSVIAGENATGKSNLGDALRVLSRIATRLDLDTSFEGIERPIRVGAGTGAISVSIVAPEGESLQYDIEFSATPPGSRAFEVVREELRGDGIVFLTRSPSGEVPFTKPDGQMTAPVYVLRNDGQLKPMDSRSRSLTALFGSVLADDVSERSLEYIFYAWEVLKRIQNLALVPQELREAGAPGAETVQETGRDFPAILKRMWEEPQTRTAVIAWLKELTPTDIQELGFFDDPDQRIHLEVREGGGGNFGVHNVSDGTLRFLAVLTAILGAREHTTYFLEELESGLHPSRVWLLVRLIEQHVGENDLQVIATTHSPEVLDRINDRTFRDSTVVANIQGNVSSSAHRIADLPNAAKLRQSRGLGRLLRNGWMEDMLHFRDEDTAETAVDPETVAP